MLQRFSRRVNPRTFQAYEYKEILKKNVYNFNLNQFETKLLAVKHRNLTWPCFNVKTTHTDTHDQVLVCCFCSLKKIINMITAD